MGYEVFVNVKIFKFVTMIIEVKTNIPITPSDQTLP